MRASPSDRLVRSRTNLFGVLASASALLAAPIQAQDASIVSKAVSYGTSEAGLAIGTVGGAELDIRFENGTITLGGDAIGAYEPGGVLEDSWRTLVARAVQLDDGPLAEALVDWQPPEGLQGEASAIAGTIDAALEALLADPSPEAVAPNAPDAPGVVDGGALSRLLSRLDVLGSVGGLVGDLQLDDLRIVVGDDFEVDEGMVIDGSVLVVDGDVEISGRIRGDLLVADGDVELRNGGVVEGDLRYSDGFLDLDGGTVLGDIREIDSGMMVVDADFRDELSEQIRADIEAEVRTVAPRSRRTGIFHRIGNTIGEVIEVLMTIFVLGLFGVMVNFFAGENIDRVAEVARRSPGRSATVGVAAGFLAIPVWIVGIIGLAISIIGIPALIVWAPGFPLVVMLAAGLGYVAVARNVGTWLTHQNVPGFEWVRVTRPNSLIFGGITVLMAPYLAEAVLGLGGGFLSGLRDLATFVGVVLGLAVTAVGFGSVLVTRGGRRTEYEGDDWYADLQDLGSELGDLRGFASDFGRRWTKSDRTDVDDSGFDDVSDDVSGEGATEETARDDVSAEGGPVEEATEAHQDDASEAPAPDGSHDGDATDRHASDDDDDTTSRG
jgi:hypothetical protein